MVFVLSVAGKIAGGVLNITVCFGLSVAILSKVSVQLVMNFFLCLSQRKLSNDADGAAF